jgi:hypothetical protein
MILPSAQGLSGMLNSVLDRFLMGGTVHDDTSKMTRMNMYPQSMEMHFWALAWWSGG